MSDFLSQLADRALALPPTVRPRLPSFYEPAATPVLQNSLEEHVEVPAEPLAHKPGHEHRLRPRDEEAGSRQASPRIDQEDAPTRDGKVSPPPQSEQPVLATRHDPRPASLPDESELGGKIKAVEPKTPPHQVARKDKRDLEHTTPARAGQAASPSEQTKTSFADRSPENDVDAPTLPTPEASTEPRIFPPELKSHTKKTASQPAVVTVQPAQRPPKEQAAPPFSLTPVSREGPRPASAPSVQVTIGRVEIRAILPPAPEQRPAPTPSSARLSLDEYLKRNAGVSR